jgi:hypothetical protein
MEAASAIASTASSDAFLVHTSGNVIAHKDTSLTMKASTDLDPQLTLTRILELTQLTHLAPMTLRDQRPRKLGQLRDTLRETSTGDDDLPRPLETTGTDELAETALSFHAFVEKPNTVLVELRNSSGSVHVAAQEIAAGNRDLCQHLTRRFHGVEAQRSSYSGVRFSRAVMVCVSATIMRTIRMSLSVSWAWRASGRSMAVAPMANTRRVSAPAVKALAQSNSAGARTHIAIVQQARIGRQVQREQPLPPATQVPGLLHQHEFDHIATRPGATKEGDALRRSPVEEAAVVVPHILGHGHHRGPIGPVRPGPGQMGCAGRSPGTQVTSREFHGGPAHHLGPRIS